MSKFDDMRRDAIEALAELNLDEEAMVGMRRVADESIAELVEAGYPRAAAGAVTMLAIVQALNSIPAFANVRLSHVLGEIAKGKRTIVPIEMTTALMIVVSTVAPDPEWDRAEG